jgi:di/tricarboxylate transporter
VIILEFSIYAWITIVTVLVTFGILLFTRLRSDLVFLCVVGVLFVTGVLNANEALSGFSSTTVAVVGVMFVVVAGLTYTGVLHWIIKNMLGRPKDYTRALLRLMIPVAVLSPFLNTATVVTMFVGVVKMWSRKVKMMPSRLLIPICLAGNMGAVCVIFVLPSNLVVSGFYETNSGHAMSVLAPAIPGLAGLMAGMLTMIVLRRLLPERKAPEAAFESTGDYTVELLVPSDNPYIAKRVGQLGLNNVVGGSLIELRHFDDDKIMSPVPDKEPLMGGDRLVYAGQIDDLLELKKKYGLVSADHYVFHYSEVDTNRQLRTAYINFGSSLINTKIGNGNFERNNNVTLVAVARKGKRIEQPPREVVLQAGDTLLLECPPNMKMDTTALGQQLQFFDSTDVPDIGRHTIISTAIMIVMVALNALGIMSLLQSAFIAAGAMLIFRCCSASQAMNAIKWNLLATLAGSIVLGLAIQKTGIAAWISQGILNVSGSNPLIVMIAVCLATAVITEFLSNTAVAAMIVPIMYSAAIQLGYDPLPFLIALIMAANSSLATPVGSSVNMLVYGPGGYRFSDFLRIGVPVKVAFLAVSILFVIIVYPLTPLHSS